MSIAKYFRYGCPTVWAIGLLAVLFCAGFAPCSVYAQGTGYIEDPVDDAQRQSKPKVSTMFRVGSFGPGEQDVFDKYYENYALARWSRWSDPDNRHLLTDYRRDLATDLLRAKSGTVHDHLRDLALRRLTTMATQNYHPAARVNAMLMIGELNQVEAVRSSDTPVPYAVALQTVLLPAVSATTQPDAVKVAALVGILRHATLGATMPPTVQTEMIKLVTSKTPPGPAADGRDWMRVQAVRVLGVMGSPGANGAVSNAIATMMADSQLRLSARCIAAQALGQLRYGSTGWANAGAAVELLRQLVIEACDKEKSGVLRRRLASHLLNIATGLSGDPEDTSRNGIGPLAAGGNGPQLVAGLKASLAALEGILRDESLDALTLTGRVGQEAAKIRALAP
ncbi:MAG TPA: hypothetical protein VE890_00685 [Thermoguttaceae bacterium]|nr:hypothetical protein [Thermoguttaceae bacterium]